MARAAARRRDGSRPERPHHRRRLGMDAVATGPDRRLRRALRKGEARSGGRRPRMGRRLPSPPGARRGRHADQADGDVLPFQGLRIIGARIEGDVDLEDARVAVPIKIVASRVDGSVTLSRIRTEAVISLERSRIGGDLAAAGLRADADLLASGTTVTGDVDLTEADVTRLVDFTNAKVWVRSRRTRSARTATSTSTRTSTRPSTRTAPAGRPSPRGSRCGVRPWVVRWRSTGARSAARSTRTR